MGGLVVAPMVLLQAVVGGIIECGFTIGAILAGGGVAVAATMDATIGGIVWSCCIA